MLAKDEVAAANLSGSYHYAEETVKQGALFYLK